MKIKSLFLLAVLTSVGFASQSNAATLNTGPLYADNDSYHACNIVNIGTVDMPVTVNLVNGNGVVIETDTLTLSPGEMNETSGASNGVYFARCQFVVKSIAKVRANITVYHWTGSFYDVIGTEIAR